MPQSYWLSLVPQSKEVLKTNKPTNKDYVERECQRNTGSEWKSPHWLKMEWFEEQNKVGLDSNTKHKINTHESMFILANNWAHKWMEKEHICPAEEFQIFYVIDTLPPRKWSIHLPAWVWIIHSNFLPKGTEWGKSRVSNFMVEKPNKTSAQWSG